MHRPWRRCHRGCRLKLLTRRPDIRQAEQQRVAPTPTSAPRGPRSSPHLAHKPGGHGQWRTVRPVQERVLGLSIAPSLLLPICDAGRNRPTSIARRRAGALPLPSTKKAIQTAFREVSDALAGQARWANRHRRSNCRWTPNRRVCSWPICATATACQLPRSLDAQRSLLPPNKRWYRYGWRNCKTRCRCTKPWAAALPRPQRQTVLTPGQATRRALIRVPAGSLPGSSIALRPTTGRSAPSSRSDPGSADII